MMENEKTLVAPDAKILVVDDNELNLKVACGLLNLLKIKAKTASSGSEAIEVVQQDKFDIVFMDQKMPDMYGDEATAHIRKLGAEYEDLPVIALTASVLDGARDRFISMGFDDFISKPLDYQELNHILRQWLAPEKIIDEIVKHQDKTESPVDLMKSISAISEIDVNDGLRYVSGKEDMYLENVEFFLEGLLSKCFAMSVHLKGGEAERFMIEVHAMKTGLATIGAVELSKTAYSLERASNNGDIEFCAKEFPAFYKKLTELHKNLSDVFQGSG